MDIDSEIKGKQINKDNIRVKRKTLQALLDDCQRALELLNLAEVSSEDDEEVDQTNERNGQDSEADELYDLIKSRVECDDFLEKIESAQVSAPQHITEDGSSWDVVSEDDLWDDESMVQSEEDYVLVKEEDIAEGIACFMATYLSSLKQTKDLTPEQLQKALSKMFSVKKRKGKLRKAWDGSKVAYNVASWSATVIGYTSDLRHCKIDDLSEPGDPQGCIKGLLGFVSRNIEARMIDGDAISNSISPL